MTEDEGELNQKAVRRLMTAAVVFGGLFLVSLQPSITRPVLALLGILITVTLV